MIKIREKMGITILYLEGRIDINASEIIETIGRLLKDDKLKIICNFSDVDFVDYSGLSILAIAYKNVENHKGNLKFCNLKLHVKELFKTVRLDKVFDYYNSEEAALNSFNEKMTEIAQMDLRRKFQRTETNVDIKFKDRGRPGGVKKYYTGRILNMSGSGVFIYASRVLPVRTRVEMEISLPSEIAPLEIKGEVIWVADKQLQPHDYPGMGIQFMDIDSDKQKDILSFVERNITHRSKTGNA